MTPWHPVRGAPGECSLTSESPEGEEKPETDAMKAAPGNTPVLLSRDRQLLAQAGGRLSGTVMEAVPVLPSCNRAHSRQLLAGWARASVLVAQQCCSIPWSC